MQKISLWTVSSLMFLIAPLIVTADTTGTYRFMAPLSPSAEMPLVTDREAVGEARVTIHVTRDDAGVITSAYVDFDVEYYVGDAEEFLALHIHRGGAGMNGSIVVSSGQLDFGTDSVMADAGGGRLWKQRDVAAEAATGLTGAEGFAVLDEIAASPSDFYVNLHSSTHRPGLMRGQLQPTQLSATQRVSSMVEAVESLLRQVAFLLGIGPRLDP